MFLFFPGARHHHTTHWYGPKYSYYSRNTARIASFATWPADAKQKAEKFSSGVFFYTGKISLKIKASLLQ
jgi:hypothetical protein